MAEFKFAANPRNHSSRIDFMKTQQRFKAPLSILLAMGLTACSSLPQASNAEGVKPTGLEPCGSAPRCVSSDVGSDETSLKSYIPPFALATEPYKAWDALTAEISDTERTTIAEQKPGYLRAEVISPWRFYTDDLEARLDLSQRVIHVRSSSRIGYYDFGVNRERVEKLRNALLAQGVIAP